MGGKPTRIDVDSARQQNSRLRDTAIRFHQSYLKMNASAEQYDGCWGGDKFGTAFAKNYKPASDSLLKSDGSEGLSGTADVIDEGIVYMEDTDQNNANSL
ncbi:hypothetical protein [Kutzneria kofuensis]|uniref:WXG100 family type VII secretion target n=1 Tax=Kutzneria kofuensis TaxID=103725 RepID=A0A7W9KPN4_9PSEU|nr:hypothetical protein [Kutzneria kofuensis]MBB5896320.1 hypothetical protein [Kutzneria kofuensis]